MRKLILTSLLLSCCYAGFSQTSAAASTSAEIVAPVAFQKTGDLNFHHISASSSRGVLQVDANGKWTKTRGIKISKSSSSFQPAAFSLSTENNTLYDVTIVSDQVNTSRTGRLIVNNFTSCSSSDPSGRQTLNVGGTLNVEGNISPGNYTSSSLNIIINYN